MGRYHGILAAPSGAFSSEFFTDLGSVRWGDSREHWRIRDCNGTSYAWVDGYEAVSKHEMYAVETVVDIVDGRDISACKDGAAFAPLALDHPVVVDQWFRIWSADHKYWRPGYWHAEFKPTTASNPCQAGRPLPAIELHEVWWDSAAGWVRGHPTIAGQLPWIGDKSNPIAWTDGKPVPIAVISTSVETFALGQGLWTISEGGGTVCQASLSTW